MTPTPRAVVLDPLTWVSDFSYSIERDLLAARGVELIVPRDRGERDELLADADVLISAGIESLSGDVIDRLRSCVGIVAAQVGLDHIDLEAADAAGIPVINVTASTEEVADHAMALVLAAVKRLPAMQAAAGDRQWEPLRLPERGELRRLRGQVMGIIGPGRVGMAVAARARGFGFETIATARSERPGVHRGTHSSQAAEGVELVSFPVLLGRADVIVVTADANPTSIGILDAKAFERMKRGTVVVNVSRGTLIDEDALADALDSGIVAMAGLDVRRDEPPDPASDRLTGHQRVIQTPHVAGASREAREDLHRLTALRVLEFLHRAGRLDDPPPQESEDVDVEQVHHVDDFEEIARGRLSETTLGYVAGGAGQERTIRRNRESLDRLLLVPRVLRNVREVSSETTVLGTRLGFPLLLAPSAVQRLAHPDGELATARAARDAGITMVLSMNASTSLEEVAAEGVSFWMQLYCAEDRRHMTEIIGRAEAAGAGALCLTVDHAGMPTRLRELRRPLVVPSHVRFVHLADDPAQRGVDRSLSWSVVEWLRQVSELPIVLKGVLHPEDARTASELGVDGLIVSNHGGRQLDGAVSAYDVLPEILAATDGRTEVLADGGIRSGVDLMRALALGAQAGLIGRPVWWGLASAGQAGVARVIDLIRSDFIATMRLCGVSETHDIGPQLLFSP